VAAALREAVEWSIVKEQEPENQTTDEAGRETLLPVVGIGASAGGVTALNTLMPALQPDSGVAYVIVLHLAPDHESMLAGILARTARMPVLEITDGMVVEANHIYVIPGNASLTIKDGRLHLAPRSEIRGARSPIDVFFQSLAEACGEDAACVVLSGTGSDGTAGLSAIKEQGGLTIVQQAPEFDGMTKSAVATGMVDYVLPLEQIPAKLEEHYRQAAQMEAATPGEDGHQTVKDMAMICQLLRARTGHDFGGYKTKTVVRRVQRRMRALKLSDTPALIDRLRRDPEEVDVLFQDLLIGVTSFFRDPAAFDVLEQKVMPQLIKKAEADGSIRVWVPGCSTGEEAYSIGMLLLENCPEAKSGPTLQIFATDIDERALQTARAGRYPLTIANAVSATRLERFFIREDDAYRVGMALREICVFSNHDLLRDPPFSRLDLVSCRNLLIYLSGEVQDRLIPLFHFVLNPSGFLFLGPSEGISGQAMRFESVDKSARIFRTRQYAARRLPDFPVGIARRGARNAVAPDRRELKAAPLQGAAERNLLEYYAPAFVIVGADGAVVLGSGGTGKYLQLGAGAPKIDVFNMARQGLRSELRAAFTRAVATGEVTIRRNVAVSTDGGIQRIDIIVHPMPEDASHEQLYMLVFRDLGPPVAAVEPAPVTVPTADEASKSYIQRIERELQSTRERLHVASEELDTVSQELRSGNEELQSANEELETSKEELQSINEELQTVNSELNARIEDLGRVNSDIANLLKSTQIAAVFLDRDLRVKSFTPTALEVFRLVETDAGRPITHVMARFEPNTVPQDAENVLRTLISVEREVERSEPKDRFMMRMIPYRTVDNVVAGVVVTFTNITAISDAQARIGKLSRDLSIRVHSLETLLDVVPVGILILEDIRKPSDVYVNRYGATLLGEANGGDDGRPRKLAGQIRLIIEETELGEEESPLRAAARSGKPTPVLEGHLLRVDGKRVDVTIAAAPLVDDLGTAYGSIAAIVDISSRKAAEDHLQSLLFELQHRVKNVIATISALASRTMKGEISLPQFAQSFQGRLRGMAATHDLLSRSNWTGASLKSLVETTLQPYVASGSGQLSLAGPDVRIPPNVATTLGMVLYELTTNAAKYGALSQPQGRMQVSWTTARKPDTREVTLIWSETGGKPIDETAKPGFGSRFVSRSVEYELGGEAECKPAPDGLVWTLTFPLHRQAPPT